VPHTFFFICNFTCIVWHALALNILSMKTIVEYPNELTFLMSSNLNRLHFNFNWLFVLCLWENRRTMNYIHIHIACLLELICIPSFHHIDDFMDAKSISLVSKYVQWCCGRVVFQFKLFVHMFVFFFSMLFGLMIKLLRVGCLVYIWLLYFVAIRWIYLAWNAFKRALLISAQCSIQCILRRLLSKNLLRRSAF